MNVDDHDDGVYSGYNKRNFLTINKHSKRSPTPRDHMVTGRSGAVPGLLLLDGDLTRVGDGGLEPT